MAVFEGRQKRLADFQIARHALHRDAARADRFRVRRRLRRYVQAERDGFLDDSQGGTVRISDSGEAILVSDAGNSIVAVNPAFCRLTGYEPADMRWYEAYAALRFAIIMFRINRLAGVAVLSLGAAASTALAQGKELKVGLLLPSSQVFAAYGDAVREGFDELAYAQPRWPSAAAPAFAAAA